MRLKELTSSEAILARVQDVFRAELDDEDLVIGPETSQKHLKTWDSLAHIRLVSGIESEFDIQFNLTEIEADQFGAPVCSADRGTLAVSEPQVSTSQPTRLPLQALPWLPRPSGKMRERLASLPAEPLEALKFLQSLAQAAWGEADLRASGPENHAAF